MRIRTSLAALCVLALVGTALNAAPAFGGGPGNQSGGISGGGGFPGGGDMIGGQGGSFAYDNFISVTTNAYCLVREGTLYGYTAALGTSVTPTAASSVTRLADGVFAGNTAITTVDLSKTSVTEIPDSAFAYCTALKSVVLPSTCTLIATNAFEGCTALTMVDGDGLSGGTDDSEGVDDSSGSGTADDADAGDGNDTDDAGDVNAGSEASPALAVANRFVDDAPVSGLASVYNGYILDGDELVGSVLVKLGRANARTSVARVSATVQLLGLKKVTLSGSQAISSSAPTEMTLEKTVGGVSHTLVLRLAAESFIGSFDGLTVVGARNVSAAKESRAAEYVDWYGTWTAALTATNAAGTGAALAGGYSALSVKIAAKGKASVSGVMADGTKVSVSGQQLLLSSDGATACLPVVVPLYRGKLGGFGFLLTLARSGEVGIVGLSEWDAALSTTGSFSAELAVVDVAPLAALSGETVTFLLDADTFPAMLSSRAVDASLLPVETPLVVSGGKRLAATDQTARLRITYRAATGLFTGSFTAFTQNGIRLAKTTIKINGVFVGGVGYGSALLKKVCSVKIEIE